MFQYRSSIDLKNFQVLYQTPMGGGPVAGLEVVTEPFFVCRKKENFPFRVEWNGVSFFPKNEGYVVIQSVFEQLLVK